VANSTDCLFCRIARGEIPTELVHQDEAVTVFRDINPQAPTHLLLIPNEHIASTNDLRPEHDALVGRLIRTAASVAAKEGVGESGYRLLSNCGPHAGQLVKHLHFHLVGGREMGWPPG
jgi:histidine triad (HIT) family protein